METVRVTATVLDYRGESFSEGEYLAVPGDVADEFTRRGVAERVKAAKPAQRRERAVKQGRESR